MRLFIVHDAAGTIYQTVTCPTDAPVPAWEIAPGLAFAEIDPPEGVGEDTDFQEFIKDYRVTPAAQQKRSVVRLRKPEA
jgi:hypothetical protein